MDMCGGGRGEGEEGGDVHQLSSANQNGYVHFWVSLALNHAVLRVQGHVNIVQDSVGGAHCNTTVRVLKGETGRRAPFASPHSITYTRTHLCAQISRMRHGET